MTHERTIALVGLGNPGGEYAKSRHNVGFMVVDAIAADLGDVTWQTKKDLHCELASATTHGVKVLLVKPRTFMNLSGKCVAALKQFYKLNNDDIWVVHDDLDLPLGKGQIRQGGGLAGHHGLESTAQQLGGETFNRIRVGIRGHELRSYHQEQGIDTNSFVMGDFTTKEKDVLDRMIAEVVRVFGEVLGQHETRSHTITVAGYETFDGHED
jgi:peptidyl-tRNA hydrolase, PTH1 family